MTSVLGVILFGIVISDTENEEKTVIFSLQESN